MNVSRCTVWRTLPCSGASRLRHFVYRFMARVHIATEDTGEETKLPISLTREHIAKGVVLVGSRRYRIAKIAFRTHDYVPEDDVSNNDWYPSLHKWGTFYVTGNVAEGHDDVTADNWTKGIYAQQENGSKVDNLWTEETMKAIRKESPVVDPVMTTEHSAQEAYQAVLNYAGACNYRDAIDELVLSDVKEGKATCTASGNKPGYINAPEDVLQALSDLGDNPYRELAKDPSRDVTDTDGDGMPDAFETAYGLDANNPDDGNANTLDPAGKYTNLEMYLHSLVQDIIKKQQQ